VTKWKIVGTFRGKENVEIEWSNGKLRGDSSAVAIMQGYVKQLDGVSYGVEPSPKVSENHLDDFDASMAIAAELFEYQIDRIESDMPAAEAAESSGSIVMY